MRNFLDYISRDEKIKEYNQEPIFYCKNCLSLKVINIPDIPDSDFCDECGSTNIDSCLIQEWEKMYKDKFKHNYLDKY